MKNKNMKIKMTIIVDTDLEQSEELLKSVLLSNGTLKLNSSGLQANVGTVISIQDIKFLTSWKKFN
jgi:hypothetical protein